MRNKHNNNKDVYHILSDAWNKIFTVTHIRLRVLDFPSIRMPASFSSGRANSDNVGRDLRFRNSILSLCGENDNAGRGGASTMSISSFGGRRYPTSDSVSAPMPD